MKSAKEILQQFWNHSNFREPQEEIIQAILQKKNTLVLLPTGAGKSICFQVPALMSQGVCIVISPLISLMDDQVSILQEKGIQAIALTSKYNQQQTVQAFDNLRFGNYKFLYLSPEKLQSEFIQTKISQLNVNLIAIDEAHCISEWGHDFRPAYLKTAILQEIHPNVPVIALTASATPAVMKDITTHLNLKSVSIFKKSFFRKNLQIQLIKTENTLEKLKSILQNSKEPVIIYTNTRKNSIYVANYLKHYNFKSTFYHGGLTLENKTKALTLWKNETTPIMVATNAFGMGIDKANVRAVIHVNIPNSIENYMQEIGRAGRDGKLSKTFLIYNNSTLLESKTFLTNTIATVDFCKMVYGKLHDNYLITTGELYEKTYPFNLLDFCTKYKLPLLSTFSALSIFEKESILHLQQNSSNKSSLKVIVSNRQLIEYENRNPTLEIILKIILRNYGGAFEQFITINENTLAKKMNTSRTTVFELLKQLDFDKIIIYKKASKQSEITFLVPREDTFVIHRISKNIEFQNKNKIQKARAITQYIHNNSICRNIQLLSYFGEQELQRCNLCDVCLAKKKKTATADYKQIAQQIILLFTKQNKLETNQIIENLPFEKKYILKTLELLMEKNTLRVTSQNKFEKV